MPLSSPEDLALEAFRNAAERVPAYRSLLEEKGVSAGDVTGIEDFRRLPILDKATTFERFEVRELCRDGELGRPETVLTSSGHSGVFAFGLADRGAGAATSEWIDDALDALFAVRSRPTLLINCLPMGVRVLTNACTLADTSVRPDMAVGLVKKLGREFAQIVFVGEAAFMKSVFESGSRAGVEWRKHTVHVVLGEEPLAENARRYLGGLLGHDVGAPEKGLIFSSMGVAELGLNLFFEVPPVAPLVWLRRWLHEDRGARLEALGPAEWVPSIFTYDPRRIYVEFDDSGHLLLTTLDLDVRVPLIRYATGDRGAVLRLPERLRSAVQRGGGSWESLMAIRTVMIHGRGSFALAGDRRVYPEAVKEGIYADPALAALTTANFRLRSGAPTASIRVQLSPGVAASAAVERGFSAAIAEYVTAPFTLSCERYEKFGSGMALDYERKFQYLGP